MTLHKSQPLLAFLLAVTGITLSNLAFALSSCDQSLDQSNLLASAQVNGWGMDKQNRRYQMNSDITADNVTQLDIQWTFAVPNAIQVRSQPVVTDEALFFGTQNGTVLALNRETGCEYWRFKATSEVRTALSMGPDASGTGALLYFGDFGANIYAVDAATGKLIWKQDASQHYSATSTGAPTLYDGVLYAPVSSLEVGIAVVPLYPCCQFQGQVTAINALTGEIIWNRSVIPEKPQRVEDRPWYWPHYHQSGAPVWSSPTIDADRGLLYVGTGQSYMTPTAPTSDAIVALDLKTGDIVWRQQTNTTDAWNFSCLLKTGNCPKPGPDFDFGAPPILTKNSEGKSLILAGQKSGAVYALDPDNKGALLWQKQVGTGGALGGVHWGMAVKDDVLFVPISDAETPVFSGLEAPPKPGLYALNINNGELLWQATPSRPCRDNASGQCKANFSGAALVTDDIVFAGDLDGTLWAFSTNNGNVLWQFNSDKKLPALEGATANGGSIDSAAQIVANGQLFLSSGYGIFGKKPGNAFIVFGLKP